MPVASHGIIVSSSLFATSCCSTFPHLFYYMPLNQCCFRVHTGLLPSSLFIYTSSAVSIPSLLTLASCLCYRSAAGPGAFPFLLAVSAICHPSLCLFCVTPSRLRQGIHFPLLSFVSLSPVSLAACFLDSPLPVICFWVNFSKHKLVLKKEHALSPVLCVSLLFPGFCWFIWFGFFLFFFFFCSQLDRAAAVFA